MENTKGLRYVHVTALFFLFTQMLYFAGELPAQELIWRRAIGGKVDTYAAQGPGGDVYVVADDRALHSIDPLTGSPRWIYRPGGRLHSLLMVAPDGSIYVQNDKQELFAVTPGGSSRWKMLMGRKAATLPGAAPDGRIILPLEGGRIVCISRHGVILWRSDESAEASTAPVLGADGTAWVPLRDGRIVALDRFGNRVGVIVEQESISTLAMDAKGRIWAGGFDGTLRVYPGDSQSFEAHFRLHPVTARVSAILIDRNGNGRVFFADGGFIMYNSDGVELDRRTFALHGAAASLSRKGTLYLPSADGSIQIIPPEQLQEGESTVLSEATMFSEPLLSDEGMLIAGDENWILHGWKAEEPALGWSQFRGGSRRAGAFFQNPVAISRSEARRDPGFYYREKMAVSDDLSERMALVEELNSFPDSLSMRQELPWVQLLLEDLAMIGTVRHTGQNNEALQSHPISRRAAYMLIARSEDFRQRKLLIECLKHEEDPMALAAGFRALGIIGADWDGISMGIIASRYREFTSPVERLTLDTARALTDLMRYNGNFNDPVGESLMKYLLSNANSPSTRKKILAIFNRATE